ncbi:putative ribonuclease P [Microsporum canis]
MSEKKRKRKSTSAETLVTLTSRRPQWAYLHLELTQNELIQDVNTNRVTAASDSITKAPALDPLTAKTYLSAALSQYLGLSGTAIPIDILKIASKANQRNARYLWIRLPYDDAAAASAAMSSWIGSESGPGSTDVALRVVARGSRLGALVGGSGKELFIP